MAIAASVILPHPPLLVPEVGKGKERMIQDTVDSYHHAARFLAEYHPDTLILISPHAPAYADYIHMASGPVIQGDLSAFGGTTVICSPLDEDLIRDVEQKCRSEGFPAGTEGMQRGEMDHGTYVPLHYVNQYYTDYRLVVCSLSGLPRKDMYKFGGYIRESAEKLGRRVVVIASGDLSHRLKESGPYSFAAEGPRLDAALTGIMKSGNVEAFLHVDEKLCKQGAECGLGSFIMMAGILKGSEVITNFLSYEGPFGVGYAVCLYRCMETVSNRQRGTGGSSYDS